MGHVIIAVCGYGLACAWALGLPVSIYQHRTGKGFDPTTGPLTLWDVCVGYLFAIIFAVGTSVMLGWQA